MPNTPILAIPQLTENQSGKEITINDAILALESAMGKALSVSFASSPAVTLSDGQITRNFLLKLEGATAACALTIPATIAGVPTARVFAVSNLSAWDCTVKSSSTASGDQVVVPSMQTCFVAVDGAVVRLIAKNVPNGQFADMTDVDWTTIGNGKTIIWDAPNNKFKFITPLTEGSGVPSGGVNGQVLGKVSGTSMWVDPPVPVVRQVPDGGTLQWVLTKTGEGDDQYDWVPLPEGVALPAFLTLTDTPNTFEGQAGKLVAVKSDGESLEFINAPISLPAGGTEGQVLLRDAGGVAVWADIDALPADGTEGQVLTKTGVGAEWADINALPEGGTDGQVLARTTGSDAEWIDPPVSVPTGGTEGQVLTRDAEGNAVWADGFTEELYIAPHRYWRILITSNNGDVFTGLSELQFRTAVGGASVATGGTAIGNLGFVENAFDGSLSTYASTSGGGRWIGYDFGASNEKGIVEIAIGAASFLNQTPNTFTVQYSDDGNTWSGAWTVSGTSGWSANEVRTFADPDPVFYTPDLVEDAVANGSAYLRKDGLWVATKELPSLTGNAGKTLVVNEDEDDLEWVTPEVGSSDLPSLIGNTGKVLTVNDDEDGFEWRTIETGGGEGGLITEAGGIFDQVLKARGTALDSAYGVNDRVDKLVTFGDLRALVFDIYSNSGSPVIATNATVTVPTGKMAVLLYYAVSDQVRNTGSYYRHRLQNITTNVTTSPVGTLTNWNGWVAPENADAVIHQPVKVGVAGDVLALQAWSAGDGHYRTIAGFCIIAFADAITGDWSLPSVTAPSGGAVTINDQTNSYTPVLGDANDYVRLNKATGATFTIPTNTAVAYPIGTRLYIEQAGAGVITIGGAVGVTVHSRGAVFDTAGQYAVAVAVKVATDTWTVSGDLT